MSDTIIMYENGKAVGGEGHPTNADDITFDNTGTDIISNKTGSAIKEVNAKFDRGSVSVTADGVKTFGVNLNALFALVDMTKVSETTKFVRIASSGAKTILNITAIGANNTFLMFSLGETAASSMAIQTVTVHTTASTWNTWNGSAYGSVTNNVEGAGEKLQIVY